MKGSQGLTLVQILIGRTHGEQFGNNVAMDASPPPQGQSRGQVEAGRVGTVCRIYCRIVPEYEKVFVRVVRIVQVLSCLFGTEPSATCF